MKTMNKAKRALLACALIFCCVGAYAQEKETYYNNDSVDTCPLADKELIDSSYNLLERNMMMETDGRYGQIAVVDAATSEVLAWASLEKQLDGECDWCGDLVYAPFKNEVCGTDGTTQKSNAIELAMAFNQMFRQELSSEHDKKVSETYRIPQKLAPKGVKLAGKYNLQQTKDKEKASDEFTFVGCFPANSPRYVIGMVVVRPHKIPATAGMLSKEVNELAEWLTDHKNEE